MQQFIATIKNLAGKKIGTHARAFQRAVFEAVKDGKLTRQEIDALERKREELGLSLSVLKNIRSTAYYAAFQIVKADEKVTEDEWDELEQIQDYLGLNDSEIAHTKKELYRLRVISEIREGNMPVLESPDIFLRDGEMAYWSEPVTMYVGSGDKRKIAKHDVHVHLTKGVSLNMGIAKESEERGLIKKDEGFLIITNKRIIFHGKEESFTTTYHHVLDIDCYTAAVRIHPTRGQSQLFVYKVQGNHDIVASVLFYATLEGKQIR